MDSISDRIVGKKSRGLLNEAEEWTSQERADLADLDEAFEDLRAGRVVNMDQVLNGVPSADA